MHLLRVMVTEEIGNTTYIIFILKIGREENNISLALYHSLFEASIRRCIGGVKQ